MMSMNCVDVSSYQGKIDWNKVKSSGIKYAILRSVVKNLNTDKTFEYNYANARKVGINIGVYLFSYATDIEYAKKEAKAIVSLLNGRKLDLPIFYDLETGALRYASASTIQNISEAFRKIVENAGYIFAIYCDESFYKSKSHFSGFDPNVEFWIAKYGKNDGKQYNKPVISHHLIAHQYSSNGSVFGISGHVDVSEWYGTKNVNKTSINTKSIFNTTEKEIRNSVANWGVQYIGIKEGSAEHKKILSIFNDVYKGYTVKDTDAWCQTFASVVAIALGLTDIIPVECSCKRAIDLWKKMGCWEEDDSYVPSIGCYIYYDWQDDGKGDNVGWPDHVGIVYSIDGDNIKVIEGNYKDSVGFRNLKVNGKYIRGYGVPDYASKATKGFKTSITTSTSTSTSLSKKDSKPDVKKEKTATRKATDSAAGILKALAGTYKVTANNLNVRNGAGTNKEIMVTIPKGTIVKNYGYYTTYNGVKWLYIQFMYNNIEYIGFASSNYLKK